MKVEPALIPQWCERCGKRAPYALDVQSNAGGYPTAGDMTWKYVCDADECERLASYRIEFTRIVRDHAEDWNNHLRKKLWYNPHIGITLDVLEAELLARVAPTARAASRWLMGKPPPLQPEDPERWAADARLCTRARRL
jgi:hypothetical protein